MAKKEQAHKEVAPKEEAQVVAQEFSNDQVRLLIHRKPHCRVEFEVEASPSLVQEAHKKAVKRLAKEVTLPGFRKGKAPDEMILSKYPNELDKEWQEAIADFAFRQCMQLAQIPLLHKDSRVTFKMINHSKQGAKLTLTFETEPVLPVVDPKKIQLKAVPRPEVNEEKVEETIRQVRLFFATWTQVNDRAAKEKDFVLLDVDVIEEEPPLKLFSNTRFEVTHKSMAEWMRKLVLGMKPGESREGVSVADENAKPEEKESFKPKKVRITLKAIEHAEAPPLDDALAQKLGVANLEDLRNSLTNHLNKQADDHVREKMREQVSEALLTKFPFDLPPSLIEKEAHFRMRQLMQDADFQKHWNTMPEEERKKMVESIYIQSEKAIRMFYLCRKIIADAKLTITAQDMPKPASTPLEALLSPNSQPHLPEHSEVRQAEIYSKLVLEKAEDYLIQHANVE